MIVKFMLEGKNVRELNLNTVPRKDDLVEVNDVVYRVFLVVFRATEVYWEVMLQKWQMDDYDE